MSVGYTFAFMQNIVFSTAKGEDEMPDLPEITDFKDDIFWPGVRYILVFVLSLAPGFAAIFFVNVLVGIALMLLEAFCLPMSLLSVAVAASIGGLT